MKKSIKFIMASSMLALSASLTSCAETVAVNNAANQVVAAKDAKVETVNLVLTGLT